MITVFIIIYFITIQYNRYRIMHDTQIINNILRFLWVEILPTLSRTTHRRKHRTNLITSNTLFGKPLNLLDNKTKGVGTQDIRRSAETARIRYIGTSQRSVRDATFYKRTTPLRDKAFMLNGPNNDV